MPPRPEAEPRIAFAGVTDVGRQRKHNEDCLLLRAELDLFCVADGMGGHNAGDVASKLVATSLGNYFEATAVGPVQHELPDDYAGLTPAARRLAAGVSKANRDVYTISNTHQQHHGMGSTCVAIHLAEGMAHIAHVGDSRCYRIRDGEMVQMTRDHSLINDALDMKPDLTKEELARLPKNIITRALGMKDAVKVDIKSEPARPGDIYLLCSDGLTGMVSVEHILDVINLTPEPLEACELLIAEANDHGGTDNISAVLVRIEDPTNAGQALAEIDISAHAELEHDELTAPAPAGHDGGDPQTPGLADGDEDEQLDHDALEAEEAFELEAPPSADRITFPAAPSALRSNPPVTGLTHPPETPKPPARPVTGLTHPPETPKPSAPPPPSTPVARAQILEIVAEDDAPVVVEARVPASPARHPELEVAEDSEALDDLSPEEAAALASGDEIDLDVRGPWPGKPSVRRCPRCRFELFPGNRFCVECGARIEASSSGIASEP